MNGLLKIIRHIALATVNEDGTPHNTPLFYAIDDEFKHLYFVSRAESLHTINFVRDSRGFAVLYDSNSFQGGLYLTLKNGRKLLGTELSKAYEVYSAACSKWETDVLPENFHLQEDGYNLYAGEIAKIEMYHAEEDSNGKLIQESRKEISPQELIND